MPLLLDALDEAATPVLEHLAPFAWLVPDLDKFRASRTIGTTLAWWSSFHGQSAESLLVNKAHYFCFGPEGSAIGAMEERLVLGMYCAYRCTSGATVDRHAYYASEEMTALILAGSETSADVSVTPADLPSPSGVAYLARPEGGLVLLWQILYDTVLSVQLLSAAGVAEFLGNEGELHAGLAYRYVNHEYLPIRPRKLNSAHPKATLRRACMRSVGSPPPAWIRMSRRKPSRSTADGHPQRFLRSSSPSHTCSDRRRHRSSPPQYLPPSLRLPGAARSGPRSRTCRTVPGPRCRPPTMGHQRALTRIVGPCEVTGRDSGIPVNNATTRSGSRPISPVRKAHQSRPPTRSP